MPNYYYDYRKEFWRKRLSALCGEDPSIGTIGKWWEAMFGVVSAQVVASAIDSALPNGTDIVEIATSHQRLTKLQDGALCAIVDEGHKSLVEEILECVTDMLAKKPPNIKHRPRPVLAELYRKLPFFLHHSGKFGAEAWDQMMTELAMVRAPDELGKYVQYSWLGGDGDRNAIHDKRTELLNQA